jgi:hypothetical protein
MNRLHSIVIVLSAASLAAITLGGSESDDGSIAGADYDLTWRTIDSGGETFSIGGSFQLGATIGQPDAGSTLTGGGPAGFSLTGGFWPGAGTAPEIDTCPSDIAPLPNGDGMTDVDDLLLVINSWGACSGCPADIAPQPNGNGQVDVDDLLILINGWGACR